MTLDIVFMQYNKPVIRINMSCNSLYSKILSDLSDEDFEKWLPGFDATEDMTITDKEFIVKIWYSCIDYGYISRDYDMLSNFLDKMKIYV